LGHTSTQEYKYILVKFQAAGEYGKNWCALMKVFPT